MDIDIVASPADDSSEPEPKSDAVGCVAERLLASWGPFFRIRIGLLDHHGVKHPVQHFEAYRWLGGVARADRTCVAKA
ncbi:MAG TPA: hypothetical protein DDX19_15355 [Rhodopirellula baltica]|nr:hypothetical protein [Rhodopirellula baltica]